jgi:pimeloyl-ACP methyl ester carboxylesterase
MQVPSSLARMQRTLVLGLVLTATAWFFSWRATHPVAAIVGAACILFAHAGVLAFEFLFVAIVNRADPAPRATTGQLLRAWLLETVDDVRVFGWRQPFAWRDEPDQPAGADGFRGIVFVHGFICNRGFWRPWLREARSRGHPFIAVNLEPVFASIDEYTDAVERAVAHLEQVTGKPPVLVCHSMGGLVARAWMRRRDGASRVAHVVTIGSPHAGTWLARISRVPNGTQMRIGGAWLRELGTPPAPAAFTCWYSNCDNVVFPASTATLAGADNRLVTGAGHIDLAFRHEVMARTFDLVAAL